MLETCIYAEVGASQRLKQFYLGSYACQSFSQNHGSEFTLDVAAVLVSDPGLGKIWERDL